MLEGTPQLPYAGRLPPTNTRHIATTHFILVFDACGGARADVGYVRDLLEVETNMRLRRSRIVAVFILPTCWPCI